MPTVWPSKASFLPFHLDQQHEMIRVYLVAGVLALEISASATDIPTIQIHARTKLGVSSFSLCILVHKHRRRL